MGSSRAWGSILALRSDWLASDSALDACLDDLELSLWVLAVFHR